MDDTNLYFKQQAHLNICSDADDSNSFPSSTWFPENNRRRKRYLKNYAHFYTSDKFGKVKSVKRHCFSRLGTHHKRNQRVFSNFSSNNDDISSSNKENIYLPFSSDISTRDPAHVNTRTEQPNPPSSTLNGELTVSPFSFSVGKFNDQKSASLSIPRVFDDSNLPPLVKSLEQLKCTMSPFPPCFPEDEIDGILQKINLPDTVETSLFFLSTNPNRTRTSALKLKNFFDARESQNLITNQCQTTKTKLNQLMSTTRNTGSKCENLAAQTNNTTPRSVFLFADPDSLNSIRLPKIRSLLISGSRARTIRRLTHRPSRYVKIVMQIVRIPSTFQLIHFLSSIRLLKTLSVIRSS